VKISVKVKMDKAWSLMKPDVPSSVKAGDKVYI